MQIIINLNLAFNVWHHDAQRPMHADMRYPGGECFSYLEWVTKELALWLEAYSLHPIVLEVSLGKELRAMILARRQFMLVDGIEELKEASTLEEATRWIEENGGFDRDQNGNWSSPAEAFFPPVRIPVENA